MRIEMKQIIRGSGKTKDIFPAISSLVKKYGANTTIKELADGKEN
jgi:hypothetical protein